MEVGTEISQKIRSAIKAKLIELGAYVDDELPDYIMVMVANKKSREQMVSDLSLFLGKNTDTFAEWLHGLLSKLQTLSVDSKSGKEKKKGDSKKEKKAKKSSKTDGSSHGRKVKSKKGEASEASSDKTAESKSKDSSDSNSKNAQSEKESQLESAEVEDVRQMLVTVAPTDELAAELETTEARIEQSKQSALDTAKSSNEDTHTHSDRKRSVSPSERQVQTSAAKKHKGLTSVVASVSKDEEDEEYDPLCPAVGNVASVVKVTGRKSKIPPALQANNDTTDQSELEKEGMETGELRDNQDCESINISHQMGSSSVVRLDQTASFSRIRAVLLDVLKQDKEDSVKDDIAIFCHSVASCLKKMNHRNLAIAKLRIQKILFDYESSIQSGGNDRWTSATTADSGNSGAFNSSNLQISSSGGGGNRDNLLSQHTPLNDSSNITPIDSNKSIRPNSNTSINVSTFGAVSLQSSTTTLKSDSSFVSSSSKIDRLDPFPHQSKNPNSPQTSGSESNLPLSQSNAKLQLSTNSTSSNKNIDHSHDSVLNTISLDSLHLKRRSELESTSSTSKGSNSVLKFRPLFHNAQTIGNGDSGTSGIDSPKPMSAEILKGLAKNLKITITNRHGKSSDDDESSSEGSDESDSDDEEDDDDENENLEIARVMEDSREIESDGIKRKRNLSPGAREPNEVLLATTSVGNSENCDRTNRASALRKLRD